MQEYKDEVRDGFLVTSERKRLWNIELNILENFQEICNRHGLEYFLIGGTAIGAVRHKGFIPWDDDMDIGMLRKDFDKLLVYLKKELKPNYYVQYGPCEKDLFSPLLRIRDGNTTGILNCDKKSHANQGIFIEIYPFDNTPDNKILRKFQLYESKIISNVLHSRFYDIKLGFLSQVVNLALKHKSSVEIFELWEQICKRYNRKNTRFVDTVMIPTYALQGIHRFERNGCNTVLIPFEDIQVKIAKSNDAFLKQQFGDYMELPPIEQRGQHHDNTVFYDPDHPYTFWIDNPELNQKFED